MTPTQLETVAVADAVINAPQAHLDAEPRDCLLEIIDTCIEHLSAIHEVGIGWKVIELEIMKGRIEKRI